MEREIKFKAWYKQGEYMMNDFLIDCETGKPMIFNEDNELVVDSELEIMQYTGLKDKNDKEIYENDIVNIINNLVDEEDGYFIVKYDIETARYILSGNGLVYDFDNTYANECEVIGNIYENPDLLEEV